MGTAEQNGWRDFIRDTFGAPRGSRVNGSAFNETLEPRRLLAAVFQANFDGTGTGYDAASDMVSSGGKGVLYSDVGSFMTPSIAASPRLADGAGSFLRISDTGSASPKAAGAQFTFDSAANSPDSWYTDGSATSFDILDGGMDFFFRTTNASANWGDGSGTTFRPFDFSGYSTGQSGLRFVLNSIAANQLRLELRAYDSTGATAQDLIATSGTVTVAANALYHLATTVSTNATGVVTIKLFLASGNTAIDPAGSTHLIASATSSGVFDPSGAGGNKIKNAFATAANGLLFGKRNNLDAVTQTQDFDSFRIYDAVPLSFAAMTTPQPTTILEAGVSGTITGAGPSSLVSHGATGALSAPGASMTTSRVTTSPFVNPDSGGYMQIVDSGSGTGSAGMTISPLDPSNSLDSWYSDGGSLTYDTVNGAFDFYFRTTVGSSSWGDAGTAFRPLDISGGNSGLRLIINAPANNRLQMELKAYNSGGTGVMDLLANNSNVTFLANTVYHLAGTVSTNSSGIVTIKLFAAKGNADIDTAGSAYLLASATSASAMDPAGTNAVNHAFNSSTSFLFGKTQNADTLQQTQEFDSFRLYSGVPATFGALVYYPDLTGYTNPSDNPALPAEFDVYAPPISGTAPAANTPTFAEYTRTGGPGDSLVLTGDQFTSYSGNDIAKDSNFVAYGQTDGALARGNSLIPALEADKATITLDGSLPTGSAYMLWSRNSNGYGRPVMVNKAEAWWVGPDAAKVGDTVSLYGRNLSYHGGAMNSWIYIKPASGAGQWATVTKVNPYKVDFTVPAGLGNGNYEVWVHNGSGGKYGWSGPVTLTVNNGYTWINDAAHTFDVKAEYGAAGDGITNDYTKINNAIVAAHNYAVANSTNATVYFPTGNYLVNSRLQLFSDIRLDGAGVTSSVLKGGVWGFAGSTAAAPAQAREWETATLVGATAYSTTNASNGQAVGAFDQLNESATLANVNGGTSGGAVNLTIRYANGLATSSTKNLYINGVFNRKVTFAKTSGWDKFMDVVLTGVNLAAGNNSIQLRHDSDDTGGVNADKLIVGLYGDGLVKLGTPSVPLSNVAVQELTVDVSNSGDNFAISGSASNLSVTDVNLTQLNIGNYGAAATYITDSDHVFFKRTNVTSQLATRNMRQVFVDSSNFYGRDDRHLFNNQAGMSEFSATNNTGQDYDNTTLTGWASGVWWKFLLGGATAERGFYFENNTSYDLGVRAGRYDTNWGEQYSWEQEFSQFVAGPVHNATVTASVTSADATHVTFSASVPVPTGTNKYVAVIINGKGVGQWRTITAYNGATITLDKAWNIVPNANSTISILASAERIAIYNNNIDGKVASVNLPDSVVDNSAAIQPYGGVLDLTADENTITQTRYGIFSRGIAERTPGSSPAINYFQPNYFHLYKNNALRGNRYAIWEDGDTDYASAIPETSLMGMLYRGNRVTNPVVAGFTVYSPNNPSTTSRWTNMNVFEKGTITNAAVAITLTAGQPSQLGNLSFLNNIFDRGTAAYPNSQGINMEYASQLVNLQSNQWLGFETTYAGTPRGAVIAAPNPVLELRVPAGSTANLTQYLNLWNEGTTDLTTWTASKVGTINWLTIGATGTINAGDDYQLGLTLNATGLGVGTYSGEINLTGGGITRIATIRLIVV